MFTPFRKLGCFLFFVFVIVISVYTIRMHFSTVHIVYWIPTNKKCVVYPMAVSQSSIVLFIFFSFSFLNVFATY